MNKLFKLAIISLTSILFITNSMAAGYTEKLYLCDLGIKSSNSSNQLGVDFIQYKQLEKTLSVTASNQFSTALSVAMGLNSGFDRWNPSTGINDVSINLESDFYGSEYYLEYCYTWDRILPTDNLNYDVTFITSLSNAIPFTQVGVDTRCSIKANNGSIMNTSTLQSPTAKNLITTDFSSMRCTIKFNLKEDSYFIVRPHNGDFIGIDPNISVRVSP